VPGHLVGAFGARHRDLGGHQQLLGTEVERLHVDDPLDAGPGQDGLLDLRDGLRVRALAEQQALRLDRQDHRDRDQQQADRRGADAVPDAVAGYQGEHHAEEREDQTQQRAGVLEQHDRELRRLGPAYEVHP
jgi:hypothetical protein